MFPAQLAAAALVWAAVVFGLFRRRSALFAEARRLSRAARTRDAVLRLAGSLLSVVLCLVLLARGGLTPRGLTFGGWIAVAVFGAAFILLQTTALVPLVLNAVTRDDRRSSDKVDIDRP